MRVLSVIAVLVCAAAFQPSVPEPLSFERAIELPGVEGRIDHLAFDAAAQHLFVAALGNNTVEVVDVKAGRHLRSLPRFREPQGIAIATDARLVGVAEGHGVGLTLLRADTFAPVRTIRLGDDADNVRYDLAAKRLYVGFASGALAAVSPSDGRVLGQASLPGHPESFQLERSGPRIFVNIPGAEQIAVVDRTTMKVAATWPVPSAKNNYPMALDEAEHRMFIGCRRPAKALVYDTTSGKEIASFDIVGDTDDMFYDATRKRLYVTGGDGGITVMQDQGGGRFTRAAYVSTAAGARTSLYVADQNRLFLAVPHRGSQKAEIRVYEAR